MFELVKKRWMSLKGASFQPKALEKLMSPYFTARALHYKRIPFCVYLSITFTSLRDPIKGLWWRKKSLTWKTDEESQAPCRTRTHDLVISMWALYHVTYSTLFSKHKSIDPTKTVDFTQFIPHFRQSSILINVVNLQSKRINYSVWETVSLHHLRKCLRFWVWVCPQVAQLRLVYCSLSGTQQF